MSREAPAKPSPESRENPSTKPVAGEDGWRVAVLAVEDLDYKRRLLDDMEAHRAAPPRAAAANAAGAAMAVDRDEGDEIARLRLRATSAESTCAMLESEMATLESQTLAALAEAGRLRQALDEIEQHGGREGADGWWRERAELTRRLTDADRARDLLTSALMDSEAEIARLTRTLETAVHQLHLAG